MVESREKHLYSVYRKMRRKKSMLSQVVDVYGLRILVDIVDTCYRALGVVHATYRPMPGRFKDYIAIPRVNGYQSLHTTLFGPNGVPIEVQIRTSDMHHVAESGIAAHWKYKSGAMPSRLHAAGARARLDLAPDGDAGQRQRRGIHRERQGRPVPGQGLRVHAQGRHPAPAARRHGGGLRLCRAHRHRQSLRRGQDRPAPGAAALGAAQWPDRADHHRQGRVAESLVGQFRCHCQGTQRHPPLPQGACKRSEAVELGRQLLNAALEEFQLNVDKLDPAILEQALREFGFKDRDELLAQIGLGERLAPLVARRLLPGGHDAAGAVTPLAIAGAEGLLVSYARCCRPIPDDPIIAFLSAGRGIIIHRDTCANVEDYHKHPEKWQPVSWQADLTRYFSSEMRVESVNKVGMLAAISAAIADTGTNIGHATVEQRDGDVTLMRAGGRSEGSHASGATWCAPSAACPTWCACHATRPRERTATDPRKQKNEPQHHRRHPKPRPPSAPIRRPCVSATFVYISGQIPLDPATQQLVTGDIDAEITRVFENIKAIAEAGGGTLASAVKVNVSLTDLAPLRARQRNHGHLFPAALAGARRGRCRGAAQGRARGSGVHSLDPLSRNVSDTAPAAVDPLFLLPVAL